MTPNTPVAATDDAVAWDETDLSILRSYRRVLEAWSKDETVPPVLRDDLTRFMSWFGPLQEAATTVTSLRAEIERLTAALAKVGEQRDELELLARLLTKGLTGLTPNGSEYFTRVGENYYADTAKCVAFVRQRHETIHDQLVKAVTKKNTTEAQLLQKSQQLETAQSEIERLTRERDEAQANEPMVMVTGVSRVGSTGEIKGLTVFDQETSTRSLNFVPEARAVNAEEATALYMTDRDNARKGWQDAAESANDLYDAKTKAEARVHELEEGRK